MDKIDNPQDHEHSAYQGLGGTGLVLGLAALVFTMAFAFAQGCDQNATERRLNGIEERICDQAPDPAACLRDLLEERR